MIKYALIIGGILVMCVPEDASILQFFIQGLIGLVMLGTGVYLANQEEIA